MVMPRDVPLKVVTLAAPFSSSARLSQAALGAFPSKDRHPGTADHADVPGNWDAWPTPPHHFGFMWAATHRAIIRTQINLCEESPAFGLRPRPNPRTELKLA
jgi:hypothetical protein